MKLLVALALAAALWWWMRRGNARPALSVREARAVLAVRSGAGREDILAAHRRMIAKVHPDAGGSAALAARVNSARDLLLAEEARLAAR